MARKKKQAATFDASFWVHAVYLDLTDSLLRDYDLLVTPEVEQETGTSNPTALKLQDLLRSRRIRRCSPKAERIRLIGLGERSAISLAMEKRLILLIDDWRPAEAARAIGVETVGSVLYLAGLYKQGRRSDKEALRGLAFMARRNSVRPSYLISALRLIAHVRTRRKRRGP